MFEALLGWNNFYSVATLIVLVLLGAVLYGVYYLMQNQDGGQVWPPTAPAACPDGWKVDAAGWAVVPEADDSCGANGGGTTNGTPAPADLAWQTEGSQPSAWVANKLVCNNNTGSLHASAANYDTLRKLVPGGAHKPDPKNEGAFTTEGLTSEDWRAGLVGLDLRDAGPVGAAVRRAVCKTFGIEWDGVTNVDPPTSLPGSPAGAHPTSPPK
jgi:hypothetical protein